MKRYGLALATLTTLLITGVSIQAAGWFSSHATHVRPSHGRQAAAKTEEHVLIPTYYRQAGPRHWRDCLGQN